MLQRSVYLSHKVNARIHFIQTNKNKNKPTLQEKAHKMWPNKNIVSGEEPDNLLMKKGMPWASPSLDA